MCVAAPGDPGALIVQRSKPADAASDITSHSACGDLPTRI